MTTLTNLDTNRLAVTTRREGGASQFYDMDMPTSGYVVGRSDLYPTAIFKTTQEKVGTTEHRIETNRAWAAARALSVAGVGEFCAGWWWEQGDLYIDLSQRIEDKSEALALARKLGELAIYDLATKTVIFVHEEI